MTTFNKTIRKIHLWLGLTCGLIVSFSGLTGSLYVWQPEITAALNPKLLKVKNKTSINDTIILKSTAELVEKHKDSINKVFLPYREQQTISIEFKNGKTYYYHPFNNKFLGEKSASIEFFENLLTLHRTLGIPKIGKYIIGTSTVIFFLLLLFSGIYIWWKIYANKFKKGCTIRWESKKRKFNFDVHKVFGIYFIIPLFIIALSGAYFTFNSSYKKILNVFNDDVDNNYQPQKSIQIGPMSLKDFIIYEHVDYSLRTINFPIEKNGPYKFKYIKDRFIKAGFRKTKELEMNVNGKVILLSDFRFDSKSNRIAAQFYPIHIGEIIGITGRIIVFISGIIPLVLFITGFRIFLFKMNKKSELV